MSERNTPLIFAALLLGLGLLATGTVAMAGYFPSPQGTHVAYLVQDGGSDWRIARVVAVTIDSPTWGRGWMALSKIVLLIPAMERYDPSIDPAGPPPMMITSLMAESPPDCLSE